MAELYEKEVFDELYLKYTEEKNIHSIETLELEEQYKVCCEMLQVTIEIKIKAAMKLSISAT